MLSRMRNGLDVDDTVPGGTAVDLHEDPSCGCKCETLI